MNRLATRYDIRIWLRGLAYWTHYSQLYCFQSLIGVPNICFQPILEHVHTVPLCVSRRVVVSCKAKKKQYARAFSGLRDHYSELFTQIAGQSF